MTTGIVFDAPMGFGLLSEKREQPYQAPFPETIAGMIQVAQLAGLESLWVAPGTQFSALGKTPQGQAQLYQDLGDYGDTRMHKTHAGALTCVHAWQTHKDAIRIFFPEHDGRWHLADATDPRKLLGVVTRLESSLETILDWSPSYTGKALIQSLNKGTRLSWLAPCTFDVGMPLSGNIPINAFKKHLPDLSGMKGPLYLHGYDQNFAFGASCTGLNVGEGSPIHTLAGEWNEKVPGLWKLPDGSWRWTPEVEWLLASDPGALLPHDLGEAWIWPKYHQTLRSWAEHFWLADRQLQEYPLARKIAKEIRNSAMGLLDRERSQDTGQEIDSLYRPDWWALIVAKTRARVEFTKRRLAGEGFDCCWTNTDCLGFISSNPDWRGAVPIARRKNVVTGEITDGSQNLGGYKHAFTLSLDDDLIHALSDACAWKDASKLIMNKIRLQELSRAPTMLVEVPHV